MYLEATKMVFEHIAKNKPQGCIVDPLIADKTLRKKIFGVSGVTWWHWRKQGKLPKSHPEDNPEKQKRGCCRKISIFCQTDSFAVYPGSNRGPSPKPSARCQPDRL